MTKPKLHGYNPHRDTEIEEILTHAVISLPEYPGSDIIDGQLHCRNQMLPLGCCRTPNQPLSSSELHKGGGSYEKEITRWTVYEEHEVSGPPGTIL